MIERPVLERIEEHSRSVETESARADAGDLDARHRRLQARARALRESPVSTGQDRQLDVLAFRIGTERYAIRLTTARAVHALTQHSTAPGAPPYVRGVAHFRGEILSLVDLGMLLGVPRQGLADLRRVIEVGEASGRFAVVATEVEDIRSVSEEALAPGPQSGGARRNRCVEGVLDGERILIDVDELVRELEGGRE